MTEAEFKAEMTKVLDECINTKQIMDFQIDLIQKSMMRGFELGMKVAKEQKEEYVKTNLNYYVKVKLNKRGMEIHRKVWEPISKECGLEYKYPETDEEGYSKFQIHDFMNTFGSKCTMGSLPFCEENNIFIQRCE